MFDKTRIRLLLRSESNTNVDLFDPQVKFQTNHGKAGKLGTEHVPSSVIIVSPVVSLVSDVF